MSYTCWYCNAFNLSIRKCIWTNYFEFWILFKFNFFKINTIIKGLVTDLCDMLWNRDALNRWTRERIKWNFANKMRNCNCFNVFINRDKNIIDITFGVCFSKYKFVFITNDFLPFVWYDLYFYVVLVNAVLKGKFKFRCWGNSDRLNVGIIKSCFWYLSKFWIHVVFNMLKFACWKC